MLAQVHHSLKQLLWDPRIASAPWPLRLLARAARFPYALLRDAAEGELTLRAMSLVYTTLLAVVPLIAFSFSVLKAFDFHYQVEPLLYRFLEPLGSEGVKLTDQIMQFVENVQGVALGSIGLGLLIFTVISMVQKIEEAFNFTWQVQRTRSFGRRFSEYLSVILIAPVLLATAVSIKGAAENSDAAKWLLNIDVINEGMLFLGELIPFVLIVGAFTFVYGFIPNTRVRLSSALIGGLAGGVLWSLLGVLFASFIGASTRYQAIYSSFAIPLLALIWLYISWLVVLLGARISYYHQHPERLRRGRQHVELTNRLRERLGLAVMYYVGDEFRHERPHWTLNSLASHLGIAADALAEIVGKLEQCNLLVTTESDVLVPGRDTDCIALTDIYDAIRRDQNEKPAARAGKLQRVDHVVDEVEGMVRERLTGRTLKDLIEVAPAAGTQADGDELPVASADKVAGLFQRET